MRQRLFLVFLCMIFLVGCKKEEILQETQKELNTEVEENSLETVESELTDGEEESALNNEINPSEETRTEEEVSIASSETEVVKKYNLPEGFVYVDDVISSVELDIRYETEYNFVGEKIDGYLAPFAILTTQAAEALKNAANRLAEDGYHVKIYDAYRPQKAVDHFVRWSAKEDDSMKEVFYPAMEKAVLFTDGYISKKSRHSRGSTVDITIVDGDGKEIDMGGYFDMLDTISNYDTNQITDQQHENREYLRSIMDEAGFDSIRTEWWHFQLRNEPYPDTYFDFDVE